MMKVKSGRKAKLETALKAFLNAEQTAKALSTLGSFNRRWDPMVATLSDLGLDEKAKTESLKLVLRLCRRIERCPKRGRR